MLEHTENVFKTIQNHLRVLKKVVFYIMQFLIKDSILIKIES